MFAAILYPLRYAPQTYTRGDNFDLFTYKCANLGCVLSQEDHLKIWVKEKHVKKVYDSNGLQVTHSVRNSYSLYFYYLKIRLLL